MTVFKGGSSRGFISEKDTILNVLSVFLSYADRVLFTFYPLVLFCIRPACVHRDYRRMNLKYEP